MQIISLKFAWTPASAIALTPRAMRRLYSWCLCEAVNEQLWSTWDGSPHGTAQAVVFTSRLTNRQSRDFLGETNAAAFLAPPRMENQSLELEKTHPSDGKLWEMSFMKRFKCCSWEVWLGGWRTSQSNHRERRDENHKEVFFPNTYLAENSNPPQFWVKQLNYWLSIRKDSFSSVSAFSGETHTWKILQSLTWEILASPQVVRASPSQDVGRKQL